MVQLSIECRCQSKKWSLMEMMRYQVKIIVSELAWEIWGLEMIFKGRNRSDKVIQFPWEAIADSWWMDNSTKQKMFWNSRKYVQFILKKLAVWKNVRERWLAREGDIERKFSTRREQTSCQESSENLVRQMFCYTLTRMMCSVEWHI